MKYVNQFILIVLFIFSNPTLATEEHRDFTSQHVGNFSLHTLQDALPQLNTKSSLNYNQQNNTYTLVLEDQQLDDRIFFELHGQHHGSSVVDVKSDVNDIVMTVYCANDFIITNNRYSVGIIDKNLTINCKGKLIVENKIRAKNFKISATSVWFEEDIEITNQLLLEVKNNYKFSVPFIGSSETKLQDGLMVLLGYPIIKKPHISWVNLKIKKDCLDLTKNNYNDYYEEILKLAVISQIYNPLITNKAENLRYIFNKYPYPDTLAESLVRYHYLRNNYESLDTIMNGINGFDGFFIKNDDKILVEVKFDNCGKPNPGMSNINGTNWRQLSTPYNKKILKDMSRHPSLKI